MMAKNNGAVDGLACSAAVAAGPSLRLPGRQVQKNQLKKWAHMNKELVEKMAFMAGDLVRKAMEVGLSWDEAVASMGLASRMLAQIASLNGVGTPTECEKHATKRFSEGFSQHVMLVKGDDEGLAELQLNLPEIDSQLDELMALRSISPTKH